MERIRHWVPRDVLPTPISYAAYSCNSQLIYATFCDGNTGVFDAGSLRLRCRIAPSTYFTPATLNGLHNYGIQMNGYVEIDEEKTPKKRGQVAGVQC
ncbi:topless-related protein [Trifolium repens]|nr:topless-related protein [Trifolium repens]